MADFSLDNQGPELGMKNEMDLLLRVRERDTERGLLSESAHVSDIWLCLITLQIYDPGNNALMLAIFCQEKPEL